jgi:thioredoxin
MTGELTVVVCPNCGAKNRVDVEKAQTKKPVCGRCGTPLDLTATDASEPIVVTDDTFQRDILGVKDIPVLVDFWAAWCGPCRMLAPTLEEIARQSNGRFRIAKLNVDENPRTAGQYNISSIPAMLIFKNGQKVDELVGLMPKPNILAALARLV